jgi:hypothetical protein
MSKKTKIVEQEIEEVAEVIQKPEEVAEPKAKDSGEEGILAPKPKRKLSEAQKANLEKGRLTRDANRKKRAEEKENYVKELQEKKTAKILQEKAKLKQIVGVQSEDEEEAEIVVKKKAPKKKKVIVLPESDDEVEEEIIYKKSKKQPVSNPQPINNIPKIVFF